MLFGIYSSYIISDIFSLLEVRKKLEVIKYNKSLQSKLNCNLDFFKKFSGRYLLIEEENLGKEFTLDNNTLVYIGGYKNKKRNGFGVEYDNLGTFKFQGEFINGKRNGEGKEFIKYSNGVVDISFSGNYNNGKKHGLGRKYHGRTELKFEGEFLNDLKDGLGKQFYSNGKLKFEGEYKKGKKWNGKGYDPDGNIIYEIKDGKGFYKKYKLSFKTLYLLFEGELNNGEKNGKGKEYSENYLKYEGEYLNGKRHGKGKEYYYDNRIMFEGEYKEGIRWNGKGYDPLEKEVYELKDGQGYVKLFTNYGRRYCYFEGEYLNGIRNGKGTCYWKGKCTPIYKTFEGIFKNGEKIEGKSYHLNVLDYEGTFLHNKVWNGYEKTNEHGHPPDSDRFEGQILNGKKWKGIQKNYRGYGNVVAEFEFIDGKIWNGKGYHPKTKEIAFEIKNGNGIIKYFSSYEHYVYFEMQVIDGELKGIGKEYNEKSQLIFEGEYSNKKKNGKGKEFDPTGKLVFKGEYYNGFRNGKGQEYFNNGNIMFEGEYLNRNKINGYFYNIKGEKESQIIEGKGKIKEYDYDGRLTFEGEYKEGGRYCGKVKEYNDKGRISFDGVYDKGIKKGNKIWYYENGNVQAIYEYKDDSSFESQKQFYEDGKIKLEGNIFDGKVKEYHQNGKIKFEGEYKSLKRAKGKEYNDKGYLEFEGEYRDGEKRNGIFKEYDDNGNLKAEGEYLNGEKKLK